MLHIISAKSPLMLKKAASCYYARQTPPERKGRAAHALRTYPHRSYSAAHVQWHPKCLHISSDTRWCTSDTAAKVHRMPRYRVHTQRSSLALASKPGICTILNHTTAIPVCARFYSFRRSQRNVVRQVVMRLHHDLQSKAVADDVALQKDEYADRVASR